LFGCTDTLFTRSGFEREDIWGYRSLEPNRCCIASIALVLLKTGIIHPPITVPEGAPKPAVEVNAQQLATAQKLLLFWRKPAVSLWIEPRLRGKSADLTDNHTAQVLVGRYRAHFGRGNARRSRRQDLGSPSVDLGAQSDLDETTSASKHDPASLYAPLYNPCRPTAPFFLPRYPFSSSFNIADRPLLCSSSSSLFYTPLLALGRHDSVTVALSLALPVS